MYACSFDNTENSVSVVKNALTTLSIFPLLHREISAVIHFEEKENTHNTCRELNIAFNEGKLTKG